MPGEITIPNQLIAAGARFCLVKRESKAAFETDWQHNTYDATAPRLLSHIKSGGNYGVVSHNGIGTLDIDNFEAYEKMGLKIIDTFTDCREGKRYHVYFRCPDMPQQDDNTKLKVMTRWGDIRLPGHNSYVVGCNCIAPNHGGELKPYEICNETGVRDVPWAVLLDVIKKSALNPDDGGVQILESKEKKPFALPDAAVPVGTREPTIHKYVWSEAARNIPIEAILAGALAINRGFEKPHTEDYVKNKVINAWRAYQTKRETKKDPAPKRTGEPTVTEIKVAESFVSSLGGDYVYNATSKKWHVWTGISWSEDERNTVINRAREYVKTLFAGAAGLSPEDVSDYIRDLMKLNTRTGINNLVGLAAVQLTAIADDFDRDYHLLNLQNGTLVFSDSGVSFREHDKNDLCSLVGGAVYDPSAPVPELWLNHIRTITGDNEALAANLQEIMGYVLDGGNPNEYFSIWHGEGRNGKSVTLRVLMHVLGSYGVYVNPLTLMESGNNQYSPERLLMANRRLIVAQEPNKHDENAHRKDTTKLDAAFIKAASGKDVIPARKIMSNDIRHIRVSGLICFCCNPLPKVTDSSLAFWERLINVPFAYIIPDWQRDTTLEDKLKALAPGILNWLLEGYNRSRGKRIALCECIREDISQYRLTVDEYAGFCYTCVESCVDGEVKPRDLYAAYTEYQKKNGCSTNSETAFATAMGKRYNRKHTERGNVYKQIRIRDGQDKITIGGGQS